MFTLKCSFLLVLWVAVASGQLQEDFFPDTANNLTKIRWAHAVNSKAALSETLKNDKINMIEADVVLGKLDGGKDEVIPIMAHPPNVTSDLSLESFIQQVEDFDAKATNTTRKGIKLDFKTIEAFQASVAIVNDTKKGTYPTLINADIVAGPGGGDTTPVDAKKFITGAKTLASSSLSLGWTTSNSSGPYTADQVTSMVKTVTDNTVTQSITFPVRAVLAAQSLDQLVNLTQTIENSTLTIWSSEGDDVNVDDLKKLILKVGLEKTYIDVPSEILDNLHLDQSSSSVAKLFFGAYILSVFIGLRNVF